MHYYDYETSYECSLNAEARSRYSHRDSDYSSAFDRSYRSCVFGEQYRGVERIERVKYEYISPKGRAYPYCLFVDSDNDSDGWGWENNTSCKVPLNPIDIVWIDKITGESYPFCEYSNSDPDGDQFGEEYNGICRMPTLRDLETEILVPAIDVNNWCESNISCDERNRRIRRSGKN